MKRFLSIACLAATVLFGCAVPTYTHPTKTLKDFDIDQKYCQQQARRKAQQMAREGKQCVPCDEIKRCLEQDKGWIRVK